jgi:tricorn protease
MLRFASPATRGDLNRVIQWMCSELAVGHHRVGGGDFLYQPKNVPGGLLGADYLLRTGVTGSRRRSVA